MNTDISLLKDDIRYGEQCSLTNKRGIKDLHAIIDNIRTSQTKFDTMLKQISQDKLDTELFETSRTKMEKKNDEINKGIDRNFTRLSHLERFIDKYLPVKVQSQIGETLHSCVGL